MDTCKKILFIITKSSWGGAQRYVYDFATHLPREQFDVTVAAGGNGLLFDMLKNAGIRTMRIPLLDRDIRIFGEIATLWRLIRIIRKERPDIVHLNSSKIGVLGALAVFMFKLSNFYPAKPRVIFTAHGWGFYEDRSMLARTAIFAASAVSALFQDAVIAINTRDFRAAERFIAHRKLRLIFNGITDTPVLPRDAARDFLAEKIARSIAPDTIIIGTIAELTPNKGLASLIDALAKLKTVNHRLQTLIIGDGEEKSVLQKKIDALGLGDTIILAGFIPDARTYLAGFDLFILPSLKEGLPYAMMEAMTAGLPVIATRVGGLPDLITSGKDGFLVPPKDSAALATAIALLCPDADLRRRIGASAREKIKTKFSFHAMLNRTIALYNSL